MRLKGLVNLSYGNSAGLGIIHLGGCDTFYYLYKVVTLPR